MALLLAGMVASVAGLISAWSTRRGFAVVATIAVLLLGDGIVSAVQAIASDQGVARVGEVAGLLSPFRLHRGLVDVWLDAGGSLAPPELGAGAGGVRRRGADVRGRRAGAAGLALPEGGGPMSVLELANASRWYGNVVAVNDVTMTIGPGVTGLLGPNGAGKSTLIAMMSGFLSPSSGSVTLDGAALWRNRGVYRTIGLVPEREISFDYLTGRQFVVANAELQGLADAGAAAARAIATVDQTEAADRRIATYSKGMRQRIKLASALVHDPAVLLLDEPFNGVDPRQRLHLMELLRRMGAEGRTVLFSSHILEEVEQLARHIEVVVSGRHAASGDFGAIRRLMTDRPDRYVVVSSDDRGLAGLLMAEPSVLGVALRPRGGLEVEVGDLGGFALRLPALAREGGIRLTEVLPTDESLESVFAYLVSGSGVGRGVAS